MGINAFRRQHRPIQGQRSSRSLSLPNAKNLLHTHQQFYEELHKELNDNCVRDILTVFRMISITSEVSSKCFYKFMTREGFKNVFKSQMEVYERNINTSERKTVRMPSECLKRHCFAVLAIYIDLIRNIYDSNYLENVLNQVAVSHCFTSDYKAVFKSHSLLLQKFLKNECGEYVNRSTKVSLKKFLILINERLCIIIEQVSQRNDRKMVTFAMERQKVHVGSKITELASFTQLYQNPVVHCDSDYSFTPTDTIYPGTSKGGTSKLDKIH